MATLAGKRFGFLGAAVIAEVFIRRLLKSGLNKPEHILAYDIKEPILERLPSPLVSGPSGATARSWREAILCSWLCHPWR